MRRLRGLLTVLVVAGVLAVCSASGVAGAGVPAAPARPTGPVTKLLVFVVENHSLDQMRREMPFTFGLARRYGYATRYRALTHPSLPNYLAIAGGSTFGVEDDAGPEAHPLRGRSVFGQALARGRTARVYSEGMPTRCALASGGDRYAVKHNPWAYFVQERAACRRHDVAMDGFVADVAAGRLPHAGMVVPDLCNDAHDCSLGDADRWLRDRITRVLAGPDYRSGRLAVVVTADEDDGSQGNRVLTALVHPSQHGHVVRAALTHLSLTRLYDQVIGAPPLRGARTATDMAAAFGLPVADPVATP